MGDPIRLNTNLMSALTIIIETKIEFTPDCFAPLRGPKREAYLRNVGPMTQPMYEVVVLEPTVIDRVSNEKFTVELNIVDGPQRKQLLDAVKFVYDASMDMPGKPQEIAFEDRVEWMRLKLRELITVTKIDERNEPR